MSTTDRPTVQATDERDEAVGQVLGRYKLLEKIGEGGFGVVYVAEQKEPVRRRVALKIIKLGMDTRQVVARFEAERQALALMDHPNIAKVLDAGDTDSGRPYFVMELVRGVKLTDYCDQNKLSTKQRLELFIQVCQAIQHAHQKGIIHRDIKPSNILVTLHDGVPVPKVIDFGIAKATQQDLTDKTVYTQHKQFIGTPAYMSPEQAEMSGLDVDTRSDIYSLGVLLYELLTGRTPFDPKELMKLGVERMRKTIREEEPVRPSTKLATLKGEELSTTAARYSTEAPKLVNLLRGDLDWIAMKCLEKDRTRRYETANGLAADLKRHLNNEPVAARPPSVTYRLQKAFRRNKLMFAAGAVIITVLILGVVGTTLGLLRARQAQALALKSRSDAENLSNFMLDDFYAKLEPSGDFETVARLARRAVAYYDGLLPSLRTPETERNSAIARARLALVTAKLGEFKTAMPLAKESVANLEKMRRQGDRSEGTIFALVLSLEAQLLCYNAQLSAASDLVSLERLAENLQPIATSADCSRRVKLEYANMLNYLSHDQPPEKGVATCQKALSLLTAIGALDFSDLSAASAWADIADSEAREALWIGRIDDAERLERQVEIVTEKVLAQRPSDLRARQNRSYAPDMLGLIEARRFHDDAAVQLVERSRQADEDYVRFNPSDRTGRLYLGDASYTIAALLFRSGRITEALAKARAATEVERERRSAGDIFSELGSIWPLIAAWEAQRGNRTGADQALQEARQSVEIFAARTQAQGRTEEQYRQFADRSERLVRLAFDDAAGALSMAKDALLRLEKFRPFAASGDDPAISLSIERLAHEDATRAALKLGRFAEAENSARALSSLPSAGRDPVERLSMADPVDLVWGPVLLARAAVAQSRRAEALKTVEPAVAHYHELQTKGASHLVFRQHFACALYVQALAQPADAAGAAQRRDLLGQAARLLNDLSDEARQLHDTQELMSWIVKEQKRALAHL
jgi:serine/threonine protein kinase